MRRADEINLSPQNLRRSNQRKTTAEESHETSAAFLRLSDYRRMTIDIELFLAWHPLFLFRWESGVKGFDSICVLTAVGGGGGNIHPLFAVKHSGNKLCHKQSCGEVAGGDKADVLLFAAYETAADVVSGIAEINVHIVSHPSCYFK